GVGIVEALATLAEKEARPGSRAVLEGLLGRLREGLPLSAALEGQPRLFPPLYVAIVRASERTSDLPEALRRYVAYRQQVEALRSKLIAAALYPALLIGVGGLVILFLLGYVVPRFSRIYEDLGDRLPPVSRLLLEWGRLVEAHGALLVLGLAGTVVFLVHLLSRPGTGEKLLDLAWRLPALGERLRIFQLARCYRTLGMLLRGGIPVMPALGMVGGLLAAALGDKLTQAGEWIRGGRPVSDAMEAHGLTTPVALRLLRVGERTGNLGEMMERIAAFHDEETARWTEWVTRLFGPLLMLVIGLMIGGIVVLLYLPIFQLAENLG
ncbi:MAG: type II secretion system F family protein, partial [Rhodocyclaceae bacterium]|nr:type II secretion system F family protein [Rhodocyclaceae bacterium]